MASPLPSPQPSPQLDLTPAETKQVVDLLKSCDKALTDCEAANKSKENVIKGQGEVILAQDKQIADLEKDKNNILKSPVLWFFVGVAVTGVAGIAIGSALHR